MLERMGWVGWLVGLCCFWKSVAPLGSIPYGEGMQQAMDVNNEINGRAYSSTPLRWR